MNTARAILTIDNSFTIDDGVVRITRSMGSIDHGFDGHVNGGLNGADHTFEPKHPNPSLQVTADHKIKMVEAPVHEPGQGEALIHVKTTGICG